MNRAGPCYRHVPLRAVGVNALHGALSRSGSSPHLLQAKKNAETGAKRGESSTTFYNATETLGAPAANSRSGPSWGSGRGAPARACAFAVRRGEGVAAVTGSAEQATAAPR